jgi:hypothetical protein
MGRKTHSWRTAEVGTAGRQKRDPEVHQVRPSRSSRQNWAKFLRNHANDIWACDFLQTYDAFFRTIFGNTAKVTLLVILKLPERRCDDDAKSFEPPKSASEAIKLATEARFSLRSDQVFTPWRFTHLQSTNLLRAPQG